MKNKLASIGWVALLTVVISIGLMQSACAQSTSNSLCSRIKAVIVDDLMKQGKLSCDSIVLFLPAKDNNDAFKQAQNICIRLGAEMSEKDDNSVTYHLSDGSGKFTIIDLQNDRNVFVIMYLKVNCEDLRIKEVRFITLKSYANLHKTNNDRQ